MSTRHEVICDHCQCVASLRNNGEHWLAPEKWTQLYDDNLACMKDVHICLKCYAKIFGKLESNTESKEEK